MCVGGGVGAPTKRSDGGAQGSCGPGGVSHKAAFPHRYAQTNTHQAPEQVLEVRSGWLPKYPATIHNAPSTGTRKHAGADTRGYQAHQRRTGRHGLAPTDLRDTRCTAGRHPRRRCRRGCSTPKRTQPERTRARFRDGRQLTLLAPQAIPHSERPTITDTSLHRPYYHRPSSPTTSTPLRPEEPPLQRPRCTHH